jgi:hypothetical protein
VTGEDPSADAGDGVQSVAIRVVEDELAHGREVTQPGDAVDQLWCVAAATPDDRDLHASDPAAEDRGPDRSITGPARLPLDFSRASVSKNDTDTREIRMAGVVIRRGRTDRGS